MEYPLEQPEPTTDKPIVRNLVQFATIIVASSIFGVLDLLIVGDVDRAKQLSLIVAVVTLFVYEWANSNIGLEYLAGDHPLSTSFMFFVSILLASWGVSILVVSIVNVSNPISQNILNITLALATLILALAILQIGRLNESFRKQEQITDLRQRLIRDARSTVNDVAKKAIENLRSYEWLQGVDLQGANLEGADLQGANLQGADLQGANLSVTNLEGADLWKANLQGADLQRANLKAADILNVSLKRANLLDAKLQGAKLSGVNLERANLQGANLTTANLFGANLEGANLSRADLTGATLYAANLENVIWTREDGSHPVILPDGKEWTPDTNMARFTDPNHPNFWRLDEKNDVE